MNCTFILFWFVFFFCLLEKCLKDLLLGGLSLIWIYFEIELSGRGVLFEAKRFELDCNFDWLHFVFHWFGGIFVKYIRYIKYLGSSN